MTLTLLRHGQTEGNRLRLYYGRTDLPLSPEGLDELLALRETASFPKGRLYTSGLLRAEQTLRALYGDQPHQVLPDLREMDFGDFEMKSYAQLKEDPDYQRWITGDNEINVCPGGESAAQMLERAEKALLPLIGQEEDAVCITHGGVIAGLMLLWFAEGNRYTWTPQPGRGFCVTFADGRPVSFCPAP